MTGCRFIPIESGPQFIPRFMRGRNDEKGLFSTFSKSPALFTDDTRMSIAVVEALIKAGDRDLEEVMAAVKEEFVSEKSSYLKYLAGQLADAKEHAG